MDRRNFFRLAGAASAILAANATIADARVPGRQTLVEVAEMYSGSPLDQQVVDLAVQTAMTIGPQGRAEEHDTFCGTWFIYKHDTSATLKWIGADKAFGSGFSKLTLSQMVQTIADSQYGTKRMAIRIDRDGQFHIGY